MSPHGNWTVAFACLFFALSPAATQDKKEDSHKNVQVQLEVLDLYDGLPGTGTKTIGAVGTRFGKETTTEKDKTGKLLYLRAIEGQSRWLPSNVIEIKFEITENSAKRTETVRLENFEPKTIVLREKRELGWREVLRLIPVFEPTKFLPLVAADLCNPHGHLSTTCLLTG